MSDSVISVEDLSKSYLIGHQGPRERYSSLRFRINSLFSPLYATCEIRNKKSSS